MSFGRIVWTTAGILALLCKTMPLAAHQPSQWGPADCAEVLTVAHTEDIDAAFGIIWGWPSTSARLVIRCLVEEVRR